MKKKQQTDDGAVPLKRQQARRDFIKKVGTAAAGAAAVTGALAFKDGDAHAQGRPPAGPVVPGKRIETRPGDIKVTPVEQAGPAATVDERTGTIVPNAAAVRLITERLRERVQANGELRKQFESNPRLVLGSLGLNEDVQNELLQEIVLTSNMKQAAPKGGVAREGCSYTCHNTCWITQCSITKMLPW